MNELLSDLRRTSIASSNTGPLLTTAPSVPPIIREILQIPETPAPRPRRALGQRFDGHGRRLPAGPPPPRSWVDKGVGDASNQGDVAIVSRLRRRHLDMPGANFPAPGSLVDVAVRCIAFNWHFHSVYDYYHLYYLPSPLKPALIRCIGLLSVRGVGISDLRLLFQPPPDQREGEASEMDIASNFGVQSLDLQGSIGRSVKIKELCDLLSSPRPASMPEEPVDSWDAAEPSPCPERLLLPNLTHLSLALEARDGAEVSWKQLLTLSSRLSGITHLSLAYWPEPSFTPRAKTSYVVTPQGRTVSYGGTNFYSHTIDHDWSEAVLILRMLSSRLYALEFLDLTGCSSWFKALLVQADHDLVDWTGNWGKITLLRLYAGWTLAEDAPASERATCREAASMALSIERHIRAMRAGRGRFITVERDQADSGIFPNRENL